MSEPMSDEPVVDLRTNHRRKLIIAAVIAVALAAGAFVFMRRSAAHHADDLHSALTAIEADLGGGRFESARVALNDLELAPAPWYASAETEDRLRAFPARRDALRAQVDYHEELSIHEDALPDVGRWCKDLCLDPLRVGAKLAKIEAFVAKPAPELVAARHVALVGKLEQLRDAVTKAVAYEAWIAGVIDQISPLVLDGNLPATHKLLDEAAASSPDADDVVVPALALGLPAAIKHQQLLEAAKAEALDWRFARLTHTVAAYQGFTQEHSNSVFFAARDQALIDLELSAMKASGNYGELPPSERTGGARGGASSTVTLGNKTAYRLHIRYRGELTRLVSLEPGTRGVLELPNGAYEVAAMVSTGENVQGYIGQDSLQGGQYESTFVIEQSPR